MDDFTIVWLYTVLIIAATGVLRQGQVSLPELGRLELYGNCVAASRCVGTLGEWLCTAVEVVQVK